jgi:hypothetical protein
MGREKRYKVIVLSESLIVALATGAIRVKQSSIPTTAIPCGSTYDPMRNAYVVRLYDESFPVAAEGCYLPTLDNIEFEAC